MHTGSLWSCPTLCDPVDCGLPGFSIRVFSTQEYRVYWTILVAIHIHILRQTLSRVGLGNGMKRPMIDRVYTVFKDFAVLRTMELGSCWRKWKRLPVGGDDQLALRSEERSRRETKTYDAADGGELTWTTSILVNSSAPTNGQKFCGSTHHLLFYICGGQKFEINRG